MCSILHLVTTKDHAMTRVHAFKPKTFVKSSAIAVVIVKTGFLVAVARLNATQNSAHAIWQYENVTRIYVRHVAQISSM